MNPDEEQVVLAVRPTCLRFSRVEDDLPGQDALVQTLREQSSTKPVTIYKPQDILLDGSGRLPEGYRLTTGALSSLCALLAPGLAQFVANLSGLRRRENAATADVCSPQAAIRILNDMIKLRFESCVAGRALIADSRSKKVEGVVGERYRLLPNMDFYEYCEEFIRQSVPAAAFHEAILSGRRLILRYKNVEMAFAVASPKHPGKMEPFYGGWHFGNSEVGDCSVRASPALIRQWGNTFAVRDADQRSRVVHTKGARFSSKLANLYQRTKNRGEEIPKLRNSVLRLMRTEIGGLGETPEAHEKRFNYLVSRMTQQGVQRRLALMIVMHAIVQGSYKSEAMRTGGGTSLPANDPALFSAARSRTLYDLYNAITAVARHQPMETQEQCEQLAYRVLTNRFSFN